MTKSDLAQELSNKLGITKLDADKAVDSLIGNITDALKRGERVNISGFGTFALSEREARTGRNPKTGEAIEISARRSAKSKAGKQLKDSLQVGASRSS